MRTILGPPATALGRRGLALERGAMVTLRRDAYATPPGPTLGLAIGERTTYRPGAWLLDTFERAALGSTYAAWGGAAGLTLGAGGVTAAVGPGGMVTHPRALPRDAWAALAIGALSGDAEVGLLLRAADTTADGYWITATPTLTVVERLDAGVATSLASVATPWRAGEFLRAVWAWDQLRVYRDTILVAQVTDGSRLLAGRAGFTARRGDAGAQATLTAFLGGEARQEWLGAGLDLGDVQRALGQPASFDLTLSNVAPMGGADRFAALLRHGLNTAGTYDLDRGSVRVLTVIDGQSPPLTAGVGVIDGVAELTEDRVRLACRGRDAFLTPRLAAGVVTYLAGPPPGGLTPLPAEPCAPSTPPEILPGDLPAEPVDPVTDAGLGPEAPPMAEPDGGGLPPLMGAWQIHMDYQVIQEGGGRYVYSGATSVTAIPTPPEATAGNTAADNWHLSSQFGSLFPVSDWVGTDAFPIQIQLDLIYRGPDVPGTTLRKCLAPTCTTTANPLGRPINHFAGVGAWSGTGVSFSLSVTGRLARYAAGAIHAEGDLTALRPRDPSDGGRWSGGPFPARVETCDTWTRAIVMDNPDGAYNSPDQAVVDDAVPTNAFAGPQLLLMEVADGWTPAVKTVYANLSTCQYVDPGSYGQSPASTQMGGSSLSG